MTKFNTFNDFYFKNLENVYNLNKFLKDQAKEFYNKYKDLKSVFLKERKLLHEKNTTLDYDTKVNIEENTKLKSIHGELINELGYIRKKFGLKDKNLAKDEDIVNMCDVLGSIKDQVDIYEGMNENDALYLVFKF